MIRKRRYSGPIMYAPVGSLSFPLTNAPGAVFEYTPMSGQHVGMIYTSRDELWDCALYHALLEITGDSDD